MKKYILCLFIIFLLCGCAINLDFLTIKLIPYLKKKPMNYHLEMRINFVYMVHMMMNIFIMTKRKILQHFVFLMFILMKIMRNVVINVHKYLNYAIL